MLGKNGSAGKQVASTWHRMEVSGGEIALMLYRTRGSVWGRRHFRKERNSKSTYLMFNIVQRVGGVHGKGYQNNVGFGICQGAQPFVVLLSCCIP